MHTIPTYIHARIIFCFCIDHYIFPADIVITSVAEVHGVQGFWPRRDFLTDSVMYGFYAGSILGFWSKLSCGC